MARGRPPPKQKGKKVSGRKTIKTKGVTPTPKPDDLKLPTDVLHQIFKLSDTPTLFSCMRVSRQWFAAAGPLLYRAVTIDPGMNMQAILAGRKKVERQATAEQAERLNLKAELVAKIQLLTVRPHKCRVQTPSKGAISQLDTLVIQPGSLPLTPFCDLFSCPILRNARARKVVLRDVPLIPVEYSPWLTMKQYRSIHIDAQLTLVFMRPPICQLGPVNIDHSHLDLKRVQNLRMLVSAWSISDWFNGNSLSVYNGHVSPTAGMALLIGPDMAFSSATVEIYLFLDGMGTPWDRARVAKDLDDQFAKWENAMGAVATPTRPAGTCRPNYTIKGLEEYIEEGCVDELLPQELALWRKRYAFLKSQGKRSVI